MGMPRRKSGSGYPLQSFVPNPGTKGFSLLSLMRSRIHNTIFCSTRQISHHKREISHHRRKTSRQRRQISHHRRKTSRQRRQISHHRRQISHL